MRKIGTLSPSLSFICKSAIFKRVLKTPYLKGFSSTLGKIKTLNYSICSITYLFLFLSSFIREHFRLHVLTFPPSTTKSLLHTVHFFIIFSPEYM